MMSLPDPDLFGMACARILADTRGAVGRTCTISRISAWAWSSPLSPITTSSTWNLTATIKAWSVCGCLMRSSLILMRWENNCMKPFGNFKQLFVRLNIFVNFVLKQKKRNVISLTLLPNGWIEFTSVGMFLWNCLIGDGSYLRLLLSGANVLKISSSQLHLWRDKDYYSP